MWTLGRPQPVGAALLDRDLARRPARGWIALALAATAVAAVCAWGLYREALRLPGMPCTAGATGDGLAGPTVCRDGQWRRDRWVEQPIFND